MNMLIQDVDLRDRMITRQFSIYLTLMSIYICTYIYQEFILQKASLIETKDYLQNLHAYTYRKQNTIKLESTISECNLKREANLKFTLDVR